MDWKILAASFAALVIVSSILLGGFGLGDLFSNIINTIGSLLGSSPFGGISSSASTLAVGITFYPSEFSVITEHGVNITIDTINIETFDGEIFIDYQNGLMVLRPESTDLSMSLPLGETMIEEIRLSKLSVKETEFEIVSEESGKTTGIGDVEVSDFSGKLLIITDRIEFDGNASKISVKTGESSWELK